MPVTEQTAWALMAWHQAIQAWITIIPLNQECRLIFCCEQVSVLALGLSLFSLQIQ